MSAPYMPHAFAALAWPEHARLRRAAISLCGDSDLAADLTQETLVRGFVAFPRFRPGAPVYPWLRRILRNAFLDHVRSAPARREARLDGVFEVADAAPGPLGRLLVQEAAREVRDAVAALPPEFAGAVAEVDLHGATYAEAAARLDVPIGTVRSRVLRGRARLRASLGPPPAVENIANPG